MTDVLERRRAEQARLIDLARKLVRRLEGRIALVAAAVVGSVARGDFNVWSDVDVVIVAEALPERAIEREGLLLAHSPPGVQPVGYTRAEFDAAVAKGDRLAREAVEIAVPLAGAAFLKDRRPPKVGAPRAALDGA